MGGKRRRNNQPSTEMAQVGALIATLPTPNILTHNHFDNGAGGAAADASARQRQVVAGNKSA